MYNKNYCYGYYRANNLLTTIRAKKKNSASLPQSSLYVPLTLLKSNHSPEFYIIMYLMFPYRFTIRVCLPMYYWLVFPILRGFYALWIFFYSIGSYSIPFFSLHFIC